MSEGGVPRDIVIRALRANNVRVSIGAGELVTLETDTIIESKELPAIVEKRMLQYLKRRFGVPIHWFYNQEFIPGSTLQ